MKVISLLAAGGLLLVLAGCGCWSDNCTYQDGPVVTTEEPAVEVVVDENLGDVVGNK